MLNSQPMRKLESLIPSGLFIKSSHRLVTRYARLLISPHFVHGPVASVNSDPVASIPVRARQRMEKRHGKG